MTETEKYTQIFNRVEMVTEIVTETSIGPFADPESREDPPASSQVSEGGFQTKDPETNCFAALLLGLNCTSHTYEILFCLNNIKANFSDLSTWKISKENCFESLALQIGQKSRRMMNRVLMRPHLLKIQTINR